MARIFPIFLMGLLVIWAALAKAECMINNNATKPINSSIKDLMTLEKKIGQMTHVERSVASAQGVSSEGGSVPSRKASAETWIDMVIEFQTGVVSTRLGILKIHGIGAVHGENDFYKATIFPHNIGLGATMQGNILLTAKF
ncbi:hypothetical protein NC652_031084 [Populus alba x Populus x berolinensis]|nr:hypothetical protein NC652_031084 [Populus alba x Populus x berolinensis]